MSENPYESPLAEEAPSEYSLLKRTAWFERLAIVALTMSFVLDTLALALAGTVKEHHLVWAYVAFGATHILMVFCVYPLASRVYSQPPAAAMAILSAVPVISLAAVGFILSKSTKRLRRHGAQVGVLGTLPETIIPTEESDSDDLTPTGGAEGAGQTQSPRVQLYRVKR